MTVCVSLISVQVREYRRKGIWYKPSEWTSLFLLYSRFPSLLVQMKKRADARFGDMVALFILCFSICQVSTNSVMPIDVMIENIQLLSWCITEP